MAVHLRRLLATLCAAELDHEQDCDGGVVQERHGVFGAGPIRGRASADSSGPLWWRGHVLPPLRTLYDADRVQERPAGGNFSMLGVDGKKVTLLDEWTFLDEDLPVPMQLLWLEGKPVPVQRPQSQHVGRTLYQGTAPIFITTPEDALSGLSTQSAEQPRGHAGMLLRRLKIFFCSVPVPSPRRPGCNHARGASRAW